MSRIEDDDTLGRPGSTGDVRVECKADRRVQDLDIEWTQGAIFEFEALEDAERWVVEQNGSVRGTLYLSEAPGQTDGLQVDYHLKYNRPD